MSEPSAWLDDTMGARTVWRHIGAGRDEEMTAEYANALESQLAEALSQRQAAVEEAERLRGELAAVGAELMTWLDPRERTDSEIYLTDDIHEGIMVYKDRAPVVFGLLSRLASQPPAEAEGA